MIGEESLGQLTLAEGDLTSVPPPTSNFDWLATVISQYKNSPVLLSLIESFADCIDPTANFDQFFSLVFNVDSAQGYGLDVWGRIVNVSRVLQVADPSVYFGFAQSSDGLPFDEGIFYSGAVLTHNFFLSDDAYRTLILAKALANISDGSIPAINQILINLFGQKYGNAYCTDGGDMTMTYTFQGKLSAVDFAIIAQSGVLPRAAGVAVTIVQGRNMQQSDKPANLSLRFGEFATSAYIRAIPRASQIGIDNGAASLWDGFPPLTATPIESGGIPPDIRDMNGILFEITGWSRWTNAGGPVFFDSDLSLGMGGYPKGSILQSASQPGVLWLSTAENNGGNPDAGAPNWVQLMPVPATLSDLITGTDTVKYATAATLAGLRASSADVLAGVDTARYITPAAFYGARASAADVSAAVDDHKYVTPAALGPRLSGFSATPTSAPGIGQWLQLDAPPSGTLVLPAGGMWAYFYTNYGVGSANVVPGGTAIWSGRAYNFFGFAWRVA